MRFGAREGRLVEKSLPRGLLLHTETYCSNRGLERIRRIEGVTLMIEYNKALKRDLEIMNSSSSTESEPL